MFGVFRPELHRRPGPTTRTGIGEADGLHRTEADCIPAGARNLLGGLTRLKEIAALKVLQHDALGADERVDEDVVLLARERSVEIVAGTTVFITRLSE